MIEIKIAIIIACAILFRLGGWNKAKWSGYRDVLIPLILGIYYWFIFNYRIGIAAFIGYNMLRLGYGNYSPEDDDKPSYLALLTKDRQGARIRAIWGFLVALCGGIAVEIHTGHWLGFIAYVIGYSALNYCIGKFKLNEWPAELLAGAGVASVVFLI